MISSAAYLTRFFLRLRTGGSVSTTALALPRAFFTGMNLPLFALLPIFRPFFFAAIGVPSSRWLTDSKGALYNTADLIDEHARRLSMKLRPNAGPPLVPRTAAAPRPGRGLRDLSVQIDLQNRATIKIGGLSGSEARAARLAAISYQRATNL